MVYTDTKISISAGANCARQDQTSMIHIANQNNLAKKSPKKIKSIEEELEEVDIEKCVRQIETSACKLSVCFNNTNCVFCQATIVYYIGFVAFSLRYRIKCEDCYNALRESLVDDPCPDKSLINAKQYETKEYNFDQKVKNSGSVAKAVEFFHEQDKNKNLKNGVKGLFIPSGSLSRIGIFAEDIFRKYHKSIIDKEDAILKLTKLTIKNIPNPEKLFPVLREIGHFHSTNDHYYALMKLILEKYFASRIRKVKKDTVLEKRQDGNKLIRLKNVQNL